MALPNDANPAGVGIRYTLKNTLNVPGSYDLHRITVSGSQIGAARKLTSLDKPWLTLLGTETAKAEGGSFRDQTTD